MKDELGGKITKKCVGLSGKTYSYIWMVVLKIRKKKTEKKSVIKRKRNFENCKKCFKIV